MKPPRSLAPFLLVALLVVIPGGLQLALAQEGGLRIAVVDLNRALNESQSGKRSKKILLADKGQMESELKTEENELIKLSNELKSNLLLSAEARKQREAELATRERELRDAVKRAQLDLQNKERRYTESIFSELKTVIGLVSREDKWDIVLEKQASQVVLYTTFDMDDITDKVISRYDTIQNGQ